MSKTVIFDTNVLVRFFSGAHTTRIFKDFISEHDITIVVSNHILQEVEQVLYGKFGLTRSRAKSVARTITRIAMLVEPGFVARVSRDPKDDPIIALAVAVNVAAICTYDKDLLVLKAVGNSVVLTPEALMRQ